MDEKTNYSKRSQKDYTLSFKLKVIREVEKGERYRKEVLTHHSDRGLQYCCDEYQQTLVKNKIICSVTESYDPYRNALAERVNGILKQEFITVKNGICITRTKNSF